jgi:hypothetical protein
MRQSGLERLDRHFHNGNVGCNMDGRETLLESGTDNGSYLEC